MLARRNALNNPAPGMKLHHLGYLVPDLEPAAQHFAAALGYRIESEPIEDAIQTARVQFLRQPGARHWLELVSPLGPGGKLDAALARGVSLHHLCYEVDDIEAGLAHLRAAGCLPLARPAPGAAFGGRPIAWAMSRANGLVELVQAGPGPRSLAALEDAERRDAA